jgi:hypothetical protein
MPSLTLRRPTTSNKNKRKYVGGDEDRLLLFERVTTGQRVIGAGLAIAITMLVLSVIMLTLITSKQSTLDTTITNNLIPLESMVSRLCYPNLVPRLLSDIDR